MMAMTMERVAVLKASDGTLVGYMPISDALERDSFKLNNLLL